MNKSWKKSVQNEISKLIKSNVLHAARKKKLVWRQFASCKQKQLPTVKNALKKSQVDYRLFSFLLISRSLSWLLALCVALYTKYKVDIVISDRELWIKIERNSKKTGRIRRRTEAYPLGIE